MKSRFERSWALGLLVAVLATVSCAAPRRAASQALRTEAGAYSLEVLVDGRPARTFTHAGETHLLGQQGSRYVLRVHNRSARRIEAVVSVDGLDVIDGKSGDFAHKRGYLVPAYGYVDIDGWRVSEREAAAFRFAAIGESYAAKTGKARNVGVIGVAVFPERVRQVRPHRPPLYVPERAPAASRSFDYEEERGLGGSVEAEAGAAFEDRAAPAASSAARAERRAPAAPSSHSRSSGAQVGNAPQKRERSGLGTEFGEAVSSEIQHVEFVRASPTRPSALLGARYNDRDGLYALGIDVDGRDSTDLALRQSARPFPVSHRYARPPADWRRD
jgi:hypothetical protein